MKRRVLLIADADRAYSLRGVLTGKEYLVTVINPNYQDCLQLSSDTAFTIIHGDGTRPAVLEAADARNMDVAVALTSRDEDNLIICGLCKKSFHVAKTVAEIKDPKKSELFYKTGVDHVVCTANSVAGILSRQDLLAGIVNRVPLGEGRVSVAEIPITEASPIVEKKLWEIDLPSEVVVGCILRGEQNIIPRGDTRVLPGDILLLISSGSREMEAIRKLTGQD